MVIEGRGGRAGIAGGKKRSLDNADVSYTLVYMKGVGG